MKALQLTEPGVLTVRDIDVPSPSADEVLLEVRGAGLCHSDVFVRHLEQAVFPLPLTLGHETAGVVTEVGSAVRGWEVGDAGLVHLMWSCGRCEACRRGDDNVCHQAGRGGQPPTPGLGPAGGMAEYMVVPARFLVALGDLDPVGAAPLADAAMTPYHAIRNSLRVLRPGAVAVVIGIGGLGHVAVQLLRSLTAVHIVAVDTSEERLSAAKLHGADTVLISDAETSAAILDMTKGLGAAAIFDFVGSNPTTALSVSSIAPDGIYQLVGIGGGAPTIVAEPRFGEGWPYGAELRTSYGGTLSDLESCVALAQSGQIAVDIERFPLADGVSAFDKLEAGEVAGRAVIVP